MENLKVHNVKAHFRIERNPDVEKCKKHWPSEEEVAEKIVRCSNFEIRRQLEQKYILFYQSCTINVTGIKGFQQVERTINEYCEQKGFTLEPRSIRIDNSTATTLLPNITPKLMSDISRYFMFAEEQFFYVKIRVKHFPSIIFKAKGRYTFPTVSIFTTGKTVILGGKSEGSIKYALKKVTNILRYFGWRENENDNNLVTNVPSWNENVL